MTAKKGHNSRGQITGAMRKLADRIDRLDEEVAALKGDISEVYAEAKGQGIDVRAFKKVIKARRMDRAEYQEQQAIEQLYSEMLGLEPGGEN